MQWVMMQNRSLQIDFGKRKLQDNTILCFFSRKIFVYEHSLHEYSYNVIDFDLRIDDEFKFRI